MFNSLMSLVEQKAVRLKRTAFLGFLASITFATAAGFLTTAAWLVLAKETTPAFASLIVGLVYFVIGVLLLWLRYSIARQTITEKAQEPQKPDQPLPLMEAFFTGLQAGTNMRRSARKPDS